MSTDDPAPYFANVSLDEVEHLVRGRLGFSDGEVALAYERAYAASFARDAARAAAAFAPTASTASVATTAADPRAPTQFLAQFNTSAGVFRVRSVRAWSPLGVDRFHRLLTERYYDDTRVYRVVDGWVAQFGYSGDPQAQAAQSIIADDPPTSAAHNRRGVLSFSAAYTADMGHATNRTTELYINLADHLQLDALGFTPIAMVVEGGMASTVDRFYSGYGEMSDACDLHGFEPCAGPLETRVLQEGNAYLDRDFPRLTRIFSAFVVPDDHGGSGDAGLDVGADDDEAPGVVACAGMRCNPRVELHVHLDGSIPPATLLRISQQRQLALPGLDGRVPESVEDIWTALRSMGEVWKWFDLVNEIIGGDEDTLAEVAEDFVDRQAAQQVGYTEVRWDPVRPAVSHLANASIGVEAAVRAVERGLRAGAERHGIEVHQLLCAMRGSPGAACFELARLAASTRSGELGGVVGIDLAGDEYHFNNSLNHVIECFRFAKSELHLNTTVHAGEMAGPDDVRSAIEDMEADRVGHGYSATQDAAVLELLYQTQTHLEACPAGHHNNLNATGVYRATALNFGLNTDDPAAYFANVSMPQVDAMVQGRLGFDAADLARARHSAYSARFAPHAARIAAGGTGARGGARGGGSRDGERLARRLLLPHVDMVFAAASLLFVALWWAARRCMRKCDRGDARRSGVLRARAWVEAM